MSSPPAEAPVAAPYAGADLVRYRRGHIMVLNRRGLEERSCECYRAVRTEYERLLPNRPAM